MKLYTRLKKRRTIEDYLRRYFELGQMATYTDRKWRVLQCEKGKQRSFIELLYLVETRYKSATPEKVATLLHKICMSSDIGANHCNQINEVVFSKGRCPGNRMFTSYSLSNHKQSTTKSGYNIARILELIKK